MGLNQILVQYNTYRPGFLFCTYGALIVPFSLSSSCYTQQLLKKKRYVLRKHHQTSFYL